ncbi:MAG: hypothetical protein SOZ52_02635 [Pyramidobacter sp.]|nr:hypothetical protein [Pyramidobacter sp.]
MDVLSALTILAIVFAVGDFVATKTRAIASMMFISGVIFMVGFWVGLPKTLFLDTKMVPIAMAFISILMVQMGSMMNMKELKSEWKTVVVALLGMTAGAVGIYFLASPLIGKQYAVAATGPVAGGVVAALIMTEAAKAKGLEMIMVFVTLLVVLQNFIGVPVASTCLIREARRLKGVFASGASAEEKGAAAAERKPLIPALPKHLSTPFILMAKTFIVAWLSVKCAALLNGVIHPFVMGMIFGIVFHEIGFLETKVMDKANAGGLLLFTIMVPIFMSLDKATPAMVGQLFYPIIVAFATAVIGILVASVVLGKIFGYSWCMTVAISVTCLFGFPGTYIVSEEVARMVGETEEEKEFIMGYIMPKMLIAGFTTVTIASVFLAGFLVKFF